MIGKLTINHHVCSSRADVFNQVVHPGVELVNDPDDDGPHTAPAFMDRIDDPDDEVNGNYITFSAQEFWSFAREVCEALHAETGYLYKPKDGPDGAEYIDEFGTVVQLLPESEFYSYIHERLLSTGNLAEGEDEAAAQVQREMDAIHRIYPYRPGGRAEQYGVIDLTSGRSLNG